MKLGMKQKVYGSILSLAAAAFGADRMFFGADVAPAAAGVAGAMPHATPAPSIADKPNTGLNISAPSSSAWLARRLQAVPVDTTDNAERNVFAVPASWRRVLPPPAHPASEPSQLAAGLFQRDHHLTAVILNQKDSRAVVDGRLVPLGGTFDRFKLIEVSRQGACFAFDGEQARLALEGVQTIH